MKVLLIAFATAYISSQALAQPSGRNAKANDQASESRFDHALTDEVSRENPTYSEAILQHRDPREWLAEKEAQLSDSSPVQHALLAYAAKAALEAGENEKAHDYAVRALTAADKAASNYKNSPWAKTPRRVMAIPAADYYANFVLGRLAILGGDVRSAERYLEASGHVDGLGDAVLCSYGPNLSLALEVLKKGDHESRKVVLRFLDDIRRFWNINPAQYERWSADIAAGKLPDFMAHGPNLYN